MVRRGNLGPDETRFLGREAELERLRQEFSAERALVTLVGPPGIGKTRLACEIGRELSARHPVWLCDLSGARSAADAFAVVVRVLELTGIPADGGEDALGRALERLGPGTLVLDNVEQIAGVAELVSALRSRTARLGLLATSLEPLGLYGERVVRVSPLAPAEAIALFHDRARQAQGDGDRDDDASGGPVAELVERLDGLPLAVELAAAQADVLSPAEILARLDEGFSLLRSPRRDVILRHATLEAAVQSAWNLLEPCAQRAIAQCSLFAGPFTLAGIQAVVRPPDAPAPSVADLRRLLASSLVRRVGAGPARYALYRAVRDFARRQLDASCDRRAAEARHAAYVLAAAESCATTPGTDEAEALDTLAALHDDLVEVWRRERTRDQATATRAALAARPLLSCFGLAGTDRTMFEEVVDVAAGAGAEWHPPALIARGEYRVLAGRLDDAAADLARASELADRLGLIDAAIDCLRLEARIDNQRGDGAAAAARLGRALELLATCSPADRLREAELLASLAFAEQRLHRLDQASAHYDEAIERYRERGSRRGEAAALRGLGTVAARQGRQAVEITCYRAALELMRGGRDAVQETTALVCVAHALHEQGALAEARELHEEALGLAGRIGWRRMEGVIQCYLGWLDLEEGRHDPGERRLQRALALLREVDDPRFEAAAHYALAWRHLAAGTFGPVRRHLDRALERSRRGGDRMMEAFARSLEVVLASQVEDLELAGRALSAARALTSERARHEVDVIETYAGFVDLALARQAERAGRQPESAGHIVDARARVARVEAGEPSSDLRMARRLFDGAAGAWTAATRVLEVAADSTSFAAPGRPPVSLARRAPLRQIVQRLVAEHMREPGRVVDWRELLAAGWPGQRTLGSSGQQRVRTAIWTLRRLGLAEVIETVGDSYRLDSTVRIRRSGT